MAPTLATACAALPPEGAGLASEARPALWPMAPRFSLSHTSQKTAARRQSASKPCGGFTLIELLVAVSVMALLAVLSWRGLDGMARSQAQTSQRADEVLNLQAGLDQWKVDLDSLTQTPQIGSLDWDGRVLRLTRRATTASDGLIVVAWTRRAEASGQWLRWQSPAVRTLGGWNDAWSRATVWAQNASVEDRTREVLVTPLNNWQIFYFRGNAWSNPLSSDGVGTVNAPGSLQPGAPAVLPDGIRLVLELPPGQAITGKLTLDWVRPTLGGDR